MIPHGLDKLSPLRYFKYVRASDWGAVLAAIGATWLILGLVESFHRLYDPSPVTSRMVLGTALAALALGVFVPHRAQVWMADRMLKRWWGQSFAKAAGSAAEFVEADRPLYWVVLGSMALLSGAGCVLAPLGVGAVSRAYPALLDGFLLGRMALAALEWLLVTGVTAPLFILVGMTWSCLHHLSCPAGGWQARPLVGGFAGIAAATAMSAIAQQSGVLLQPAILFLLASVPLFGLSLLAGRQSIPTPMPRRDHQRRFVPRVAERWGGPMGWSLVLVCSGASMSLALWERVFEVLWSPGAQGGQTVLVTGCIGFAVGLAVGLTRPKRGPESVASLGMAIVWMGVAIAVSTGLLGIWGSWGSQWRRSLIGLWPAAAWFVGLPALAAGKAVALGLSSVLRRAGDPSGAGAALISKMLLSSGVVLVVVVSPVVQAVGTYAALVGVSLVCVGLGGVLVIHEWSASRRLQWSRLGVAFGAMALMSLVLPYTGQGWLISRPWKRLALEEGAWVTRSIWAVRGDIHRITEPAARDPLYETLDLEACASESGPLIDWARIPRTMRIAVLGELSDAVLVKSGETTRTMEWLRFDLPDRSRAAQLEEISPTSANAISECLGGFLRRTHRRYDIILMNAGDLPPCLRRGLAGGRWLHELMSHLTSDGVLVFLSPMRDYSRSDLKESLDGLSEINDAQFVWSTTTVASEPILVLAMGRNEGWRERWKRWSPESPREAITLVARLLPGHNYGRPDHPASSEELASAGDRP